MSKRELLVQQANRQRRYERWEQVRELFRKTSASDKELARLLGVYLEAKPRVRECIVDDHASYLDWPSGRRLSKLNEALA